MIAASTDQLLSYLADLIEVAERFGATVLPPFDVDDVGWERAGDDLTLDLATRLPADSRSRDIELVVQERWSPSSRDGWDLVEYAYELRHHELDYRRALHRHDVEHFVRTHDVAVHEHCEATMGDTVCSHYAGQPVNGAIDGFRRLYGIWLSNVKPDCSQLQCLG